MMEIKGVVYTTVLAKTTKIQVQPLHLTQLKAIKIASLLEHS